MNFHNFINFIIGSELLLVRPGGQYTCLAEFFSLLKVRKTIGISFAEGYFGASAWPITRTRSDPQHPTRLMACLALFSPATAKRRPTLGRKMKKLCRVTTLNIRMVSNYWWPSSSHSNRTGQNITGHAIPCFNPSFTACTVRFQKSGVF